jgi:hypothetical protein
MLNDLGWYRLLQLFSPRVWLSIALVSLLLATGSSWVLLSHVGEHPMDRVFETYDAVTRFVHETIRLTFKTDKKRASIFVAPAGLLNQQTSFNWVKNYRDFKPRLEDQVPGPQAPEQMLNPTWKPDFPGIVDN